MDRSETEADRMNYRHIYHAGNFADVVKHVVLTRIVEYLKRKDKAFRVIDTHAGIGLYDLSSERAQKTGEWRGGIGRILEGSLPAEVEALAAPYLEAVRAANPDGGVRHYPGSPTIVRHLLRPRDRLTAMELHPEDAASLKELFAGDVQTRVIELDGWLALGAQLPPKEKRGLVLIDPPFEEPGEFDRIVQGLAKAHSRWPGGVYAVWYPIKDSRAVERFREALRNSGIARITDFTVMLRKPSHEARLDGCGMLVINPPFALAAEMRSILPILSDRLGEGRAGSWAIEEIAGEFVPGDEAL